METWFIIILSLLVSALLKPLYTLIFFNSKTRISLPPGPTNIPIISSFLSLVKPSSEIEPILRNLFVKYGPIITLHIESQPAIFIRDRHLAHQTLVQNGAVFADRAPAMAVNRFFNSHQYSITFTSYGPTWRLFRRNLTSQILHPSRIGSYSQARKQVLKILLDRLKSSASSSEPIQVVDDFKYTMLCLLVLMCFGENLDEKTIQEIKTVQHRIVSSFGDVQFNILNLFPRLSKILFRSRWAELDEIRRNEEEVFIPLIRARKTARAANGEFVLSYVDTLLDLELPEEKRKLSETEIMTLCTEFLTAGADTTSTTLHWIMANLVKNPEIQNKLFVEINTAMENSRAEVREEDLHKLQYLKAVILEGLRRHPPVHLFLPHTVTEDAPVGGYVVPKSGTVNYMVAEIGLDPEVWEEPMEFRPERFMTSGGKRVEAFDLTGSKEIKMMPFGSGRRMCPGYGLAMLHLGYFVANLVWKFEWRAVAGDDIDLSAKQEFNYVMKTPLKAHIRVRSK